MIIKEDEFMELLDLIKKRRSIRTYLDKGIEKEKLDKIIEAGLFAPNPGGRQGTKIIMIEDAQLIDEIGVMNANCENRNWNGSSVSVDQPSIIDDLSIKSGFYGCQALAIVCVQKDRKEAVNTIGSAFVCAQNIVLEAMDLELSSCIVGRGEATYGHPRIQELWKKWEMDEDYIPMVFVCLGYVKGDYPDIKPRDEGRILFINK